MGRPLTINWKMKKVKPDQDENKKCWFCFSNPEIEKELIVEVRDHFYVAIPKGGIVEEHFLLIPKEHKAHS
jgi:hypothetical protein